jgi:hypothetical protein
MRKMISAVLFGFMLSVVPAFGQSVSNQLPFTVNNPVPSVASFAPLTAAQGGGAFTLTITGTGFMPGATVTFGAGAPLTPATISPAQITVTIPASAIANAGSNAVTVTNSTPGGGAASAAAPFQVTAPPVSITAVAPASATAPAAQLTVAITGSGFVSGSIAQWLNGAVTTPLATTFVSAGSLTAVVPASLTQSGCLCKVQVQNPAVAASHSVTLNWTASVTAGVVGYRIYRAATSGGPYTLANQATLSGVTFNDLTVANGQTYFYVVTALNAASVESVFSNEVSAAIPQA